MLNELTNISHILNMFYGRVNIHPDLLPKLERATLSILDDLYIDPAVEEYLRENEEPTIIFKEETPGDIEQACAQTVYMDWSQAENSSRRTHIRIARKKWDNSLNQEYVQWSLDPQFISGEYPGSPGGYAKTYISAQSDFYKKVEHTYKPTQEDKEATDWYIL